MNDILYNEMRERLEYLQKAAIAERDCFYEGCSDVAGEVADVDDQLVLDSMDADIELTKDLIERVLAASASDWHKVITDKDGDYITIDLS